MAKSMPNGGGGGVTIFGPNPMLSLTIERGGDEDEIHVHPAGQGVWVARMVGEMGARPTLCGFIGGETGATVGPLLDRLSGELRLVETGGANGSYVHDRRSGSRELIALMRPGTPTRHEVDELFSLTCAAAIDSDALVVCNPFPAEALPTGLYADLVSDVSSNGTPVLVDLSSPRLNSALKGGPALAKLNDWELAEFVGGPVDAGTQLQSAIRRLIDDGASAAIVTRGGESAFALRDGELLELFPPRFERGAREGCGDSMMGALAAAWAQGLGWERSLVLGVAAGATNFLRHGLGTGSRDVIEELAKQVRVERVSA
jgi:1-phosphofructokinase